MEWYNIWQVEKHKTDASNLKVHIDHSGVYHVNGRWYQFDTSTVDQQAWWLLEHDKSLADDILHVTLLRYVHLQRQMVLGTCGWDIFC